MKLILFSFIALLGFASFAQDTATSTSPASPATASASNPSLLPVVSGLPDNRQSVTDPNDAKAAKNSTQASVFVPNYRGDGYCPECEAALQKPGVTLADDKNPHASPQKRRIYKPGTKTGKKPGDSNTKTNR